MSIFKHRNQNINKKDGTVAVLFLFLVVLLFVPYFFSEDMDDKKKEANKIEKIDINLESKTAETENMNSNEEVLQEETRVVEVDENPVSEKTEEDNKDDILNFMQIIFPEQEQVRKEISYEEINQQIRKSLVNILCTTKTGGYFNPISGSGVVISDKGVILTNAHVAQYYLLENYQTKDFMECVIRTGSPSKPIYKANLMYISDRWIKNNYENITKSNYSESGEHDYAFLQIIGTVSDGIVLPEKFDAVEIIGEEDIGIGDNVIIAGYPAGFLGGVTIQKNLYITTTIEQISELFTFREETLDLISLGGSILAQKGSSGGAVVNGTGELIAVPVTSTDLEQTDERDLRAITISHIGRSLEEEIGIGIEELLSYSPSEVTATFKKEKFEELKSFLVKALEK